MSRKLFCEISPLTYKISIEKCRIKRRVKDLFSHEKFAMKKTEDELPVLIYGHKSLIRRRLGNVDMDLQNNKAVNLSIAAPKVTNVLIRLGETFSFWKLVGPTGEKYGYKKGLQIFNGKASAGVGTSIFNNYLDY